jgi:geranylgeranyl diphosphate synthase type I
VLSYFQARRDEISVFLRELFREKGADFDRVNPLGRDLGERLYRFAVQGKMLRGGLVSLGHEVSPGPARAASEPRSPERAALTGAGAAMELLQSGLLVHDDIMDRDATRRGHKTIFYQYAERGERDGVRDAYHLGEALGICAGDVAYFLAFELLSRLPVAGEIVRRALALCAGELAYVGVAQMQDVSWGASRADVGEEEVLRLYVYKTGRYTFSLPLALGGVLAEADERTLSRLERLGECLGILFQVRDDELGLFGDPRELGKPVGSDIREGKKTLFYGYLRRRASPEDLERLDAIFGNPQAGDTELGEVRRLLDRLDVRRSVQELTETYRAEARGIIAELPDPEGEARGVLGELLNYTLSRTR